MREIIFDIETVGYDLDSFDEYQKEYLFRYANLEETNEKRQQKYDEVVRLLNLSPLTAQVVAIGLYDINKLKGLVLFQSDKKEHYYSEDKVFTFHSGNEKYLIEKFWEIINHYDRIISFNGRNFDAPFLLLRSALLKIKPSKNLISNRFDSKSHCDLLEQFTFYGLTRKFNFDFYCKAFGIESSKRGEVTGYNINEVFRMKRYNEIAEYCRKDLLATKELYLIYKNYLEF